MSSDNDSCCGVVEHFYENKIVFVTGGTGFMGKVLLEKLLHCCPGIKKVYVLVRPKRGESKAERLEKVKQGPAFKELRAKHPDRLDKLEGLEGDIEKPGLGLREPERVLLRQAHVVFNVAANINFLQPLVNCIETNIIATETLLDVCLEMRDLKAFVHVSTAYSNCDQRRVEERVYPPPFHLHEAYHLLKECADKDKEAELSKKLMANKPNTYIVTKAMGENIVNSYGDRFPIAIIRPSIVTASVSTPYPGWVDCRSGSTGLLAAAGGGLLPLLYGDPAITIDLVPVDLVINQMIVVAWKTAQLGVREPLVYHSVSGPANCIRVGELFRLMRLHSLETPPDFVLWYPSTAFTMSRLRYGVGSFWMRTLPALLFDIVAPSNKIKLRQTASVVSKAVAALEYFGTHEFDFAYENIPSLIKEMSRHDRERYPIDVRQVNWFTYTATYALGIRRYLLGQKDQDLDSARRRVYLLYIADRTIKWSAAIAAYYSLSVWAYPTLLTWLELHAE